MGPHGYSRCSLPPAAAYSHSVSLGRNPPSQMQKAYASHQFTQLIGRFSWLPAVFVQISNGGLQARLAFVGAMLLSSLATHPGSYVTPASPPTFTRPCPPFKYVCLPEPPAGIQPPFHALTNCRNRPTVTRYLSRRKLLTVAGSATPVAPLPLLVYVR